jgi:peptide/nickel transport system substrate-binding protein
LQPGTLAVSAFPFKATKNSSNFTSAAYTQAATAAWEAAGDATSAYADLTGILLDEQFVIELAQTGYNLSAVSALRGLTWNAYDYLNLDNTYLAA